MSYEFTQEQEMIRKTARDIASQFDDEYWRKADKEHRFP
ncbi:hypothetical protein SAMN05443253_1381, partial [Bacillus sp. OK048]